MRLPTISSLPSPSERGDFRGLRLSPPVGLKRWLLRRFENFLSLMSVLN